MVRDQTLDDVVNLGWKCTRCLKNIGFNRAGLGIPFATEIEFPEDIDQYLTECTGEPVAVVLADREPMPKQQFLALLTDVELGGCLAVKAANPIVELMFYRFEQTETIPLDDPQTLQGLQYLEFLGILATGRAVEILAR